MPANDDCSDCRRRLRRRANRSTPELADKVASISRQVRGLARTVTEGDFSGVEDLAQLAHLAAEAEGALATAVTALRERHGYSWADVGRGLGVSRQAAQQRFGH